MATQRSYSDILVAISKQGTEVELDLGVLKSLLEGPIKDIELGMEAFKPSSTTARSGMATATRSDGKKYTETQINLAKRLSDAVKLDEIQALKVIEGISTVTGADIPETITEEHVLEAISEYWKERTSLVATLGLIANLAKQHTYAILSIAAVDRLLSQSVVVIKRLLQQYATKVTEIVPEYFTANTEYFDLWIAQSLTEQCTLLEAMIALAYAGKDPKTDLPAAVLTTLLKTQFGKQQNNKGRFRLEAVDLWDDVCLLCVILSVVSLDLENLFNMSIEESLDSGSHTFQSDIQVEAINKALQAAERQQELGPFILGWSSVLSARIVAQQNSANRSSQAETTRLAAQLTFISIDTLKVFQYLHELFSNDYFGKASEERPTYKRIFFLLIELFLLDHQPNMIKDFEGLVTCLTDLLTDEEQLCTGVWEVSPLLGRGTREVLETTRGRFPIRFEPMMQLLSALASGDEVSAKHVVHYFHNLPTLSNLVPLSSPSIEVDAHPDTGATIIRAIQSIPLGIAPDRPFTMIPAKTQGSLISAENKAHVVQWRHESSGWNLCFIMLDAFRQANIQDYSSESSVELSHLKAILDLFQSVFRHRTVTAELINFFIEGEFKISPIPTLFAILDQCSRFQNPPLDVIGSCLRCFTWLSETFSQDIWLYLRQASFLPSVITTTVQFTGLSRIQTSGLAHNILARFECIQGDYSVTLAFLGLVQKLIFNAQAMELWDSKELRCLKAEVLYPCLVYFLNDIFINYESWYFKNIKNRFIIASTILEIFNQALNDLPLLDGSDAVADYIGLNTLQNYIINSFLYDGGKQLTLPLVSIIGTGPDLSAFFSKYLRIEERAEVWNMVMQGLSLVKSLLRYRKIKGGQPSFLEVYMIDRTVGRSNASLIQILASYSNFNCGEGVALVSTDVLTLLCSLTFEWQTRPSFVGYLGETDQARQLVLTLVKKLNDDNQSPDYRIALWSFISITLTTQPGLAILFLSNDRVDSSAAIPESQFKEAAKNAVLVKALGILHDFRVVLNKEPEVLPHVLHFLDVLWQNAKDHAVLIKSLQENEAFWKDLEGILGRPDAHTDLELADWDRAPSQYGGDLVEQVIRISAASADQRSRGHALRIFALAIHFHYATSGVTSRDLESLPTSVKEFIKISVNQGRFSEWNKTIPIIHYHFQRHRELKQMSHELLSPFNYLRLGVRRWDETYDTDHLPGESFMLDLAKAKFKLEWGGHEKERLFLRSILYVNFNWSIVHSEIQQLSAWRFFVEVVSSNLGMSVWTNKSNTAPGSGTYYQFALCLLEHIGRDTHGSLVLRMARQDCCQLLQSVIENSTAAKRSDKKNLATYFPQIVTRLQKLIQNPDMDVLETIQSSVEGQSAHRPLLLTLLFCYRALHDKEVLVSLDSADRESVQKSAILLLPLIANCFSAVVESHLLGQYDLSNTIVVLLALLEELCHPVWNPHPALWIPILRNADVFRFNLQLFARSVSSGEYDSRPSFFESSLNFVLALANVPEMGAYLCDAGVMSMLTHNGLTPLIQRGEIAHLDELHGDRGNWHHAWCMMLATVTGLLRSMGSSDAFLQSLIGFIQLYGNQISKGLDTSTDGSLTSAKLEEMERITMLFYELSKHDARLESWGGDVLKAFFDRSLFILQHAVHLFTHPNTLASVIVPITREEHKDKEAGGSALSTLVEGKLAAVVRNILSAILTWTDPAVILTKSNLEWPIRKTTIAPITNTPVYEPASIGTMFDLVQYAITSLKEWEARLEGKTGGSAGLFKDSADDDGLKSTNKSSSSSGAASSKTSSKLACFGDLSTISPPAPTVTTASSALTATKTSASSPPIPTASLTGGTNITSVSSKSDQSAFATLSTITGSSGRMISLLEDALVVIATQLGLYMYHPQLDMAVRRDIQDQCLDLVSTLNSTQRMLQRFENVPLAVVKENEEAYTQLRSLRDIMIPIIKNFAETKIIVQ
ncbi:hypothetical protein BX616_005923 [Lobosporangium transversale]|uniref:Nucleoporin NUP188 n=1 Tax=Lobosporangium transversale TaxID=64571 RepID=A0A1Y2GXV6_9FUNG|nr:nucleoporin subcomplex protein binding to Pom34-domain-containing protein [Lobosporangium transversale]KAF9915544.1 hypothetical protein BX616_005923 [Lobosporangium transversale]ORZ26601.1 nucleoporin subcomplex protein binding to Pom34-domain-containing protein [Lobosporangium transversale]|eukprot:XP_021884364.1 nucleoporin subcomplex protein binding to Pom34-domain-containing protein [Lobosporangium transversale]